MQAWLLIPFSSASFSIRSRSLLFIRIFITRVSRKRAAGPPRCAVPFSMASMRLSPNDLHVLIPPFGLFGLGFEFRHYQSLHKPTFARRYARASWRGASTDLGPDLSRTIGWWTRGFPRRSQPPPPMLLQPKPHFRSISEKASRQAARLTAPCRDYATMKR